LIPDIVPNLHVILIHFPLAMLGVGVVIEIFSFFWYGGSLHKAGRWMILIGALMMAPAATSGIYALYDVASHGVGADTWEQTKSASGFTAHDWGLVRQHVLLTGTAAVICLISVIWFLGASDRARKFVYLPALTLIFLSLGLLAAGAWYGGEMVYREGFGVDGKFPSSNQVSPPTSGTILDQIEYSVSPMQVHIVLAGFVVAAAAGAMGLSYRRSSEKPQRRLLEPSTPPTETMNDPWSAVPGPREISPDPSTTPPSPRFWLLAIFFAAATLALGLYVGGFLGGPKIFDIGQFRDAVADLGTSSQRRVGLHIVLGLSIVALCIILAILGKWAPRQREVLGLASLLLILAIAAQIWIGTLLLYDNDSGPIDHFREAPAAQQPTSIPSTEPATQPMIMTPSTQTAGAGAEWELH
jgi:uncharacterized membrane protein